MNGIRSKIIILSLLFCSCSKDLRPDDDYVVSHIDSLGSLERIIAKAPVLSNPIPLTIFPGKGINDIRLGTSDYNDILDFDIQFEVDSGEGMICGSTFNCRYFSKRYSNEGSGLLIEYSTECLPEPYTPKTYSFKLNKITVQNNQLASLDNGLRIGTSTYLDVVEIYGPIPKYWRNESYLHFRKKGISFNFDSDSILRIVEIFKPDK